MKFMYQNIVNNQLKNKSLIYDLRREMVDYCLIGNSYRETAEFFEVNVKTIVKWVKRYKEEGLEGLKDRKRAPKVVHNKTGGRRFSSSIKKTKPFWSKKIKKRI